MNKAKIVDTQGLTFDDVLVLPGESRVKRDEVDVSSFLTKKIKLTLPLLSAPMDTVTTSTMGIALGKLGGLGVIHRNLTIEDQKKEVVKVKKTGVLTAAAVGVGKDLQLRLEALDKAGVDVVVVDTAHGFSKFVIEATQFISQKYPHLILISGSVATKEGAETLIKAGAQVLRVGMGPGSICTTRVVAGIGVPQITAIMQTVEVASKYEVPVIADGGLRFSGDIVKAFVAGASFVMSGSLFAGCSEAPGEIVEIEGKKYKSYRGMGSVLAMKEGSAARYGQQYRRGQEDKLIAEGIEGLVPYKGTVKEVVRELIGGLRAGMYYVGASNIKQLCDKGKFIRVTQASLIESHPHDIILKSVK